MPTPKPVGSAPRAGSRKIIVDVIGALPKVWNATWRALLSDRSEKPAPESFSSPFWP